MAEQIFQCVSFCAPLPGPLRFPPPLNGYDQILVRGLQRIKHIKCSEISSTGVVSASVSSFISNAG
jgi:hypothetical protein